MPHRDIVVTGASAGGVEALSTLLGGLPGDFHASVFVVLHLLPYAESFLPQVLGRSARLPVSHAVDGQPIQRAQVYVAPPDNQLLIENGRVHLTRGPAENRHRPSINALFRSAALAYGNRVTGVLLTGTLDDGVSGLWEIKRRGGYTIVQDPVDALYRDMPMNALAQVEVDAVAPVKEIPKLLEQTVVANPDNDRTRAPEGGSTVQTNFTCPDCRGAIHLHRNGGMTEFRCRIGHSFTTEGILDAHRSTQENALWAAVVALEEGVELARIIASKSDAAARIRLEQEASRKLEQSRAIAQMITGE